MSADSILNPDVAVYNVVSVSGVFFATYLHISPIETERIMENSELTVIGITIMSCLPSMYDMMYISAETPCVSSIVCVIYLRAVVSILLITALRRY